MIFSKWLLMPSQAPPLGIARQLQPARHLRTMLWELKEHSRNVFRAVQTRELGASSLLLFFLLSLSFSYSFSDAGRWWIPNQPLWSVKFQYYVSRTWMIEACFVWCKQQPVEKPIVLTYRWTIIFHVNITHHINLSFGNVFNGSIKPKSSC